MAPWKFGCKAQAEARLANGSWVTVQLPPSDENEGIAPRETYIKNVLEILGLGDNKCKSMPTPIVQTRQQSDEDGPTLGEEDRRVYHRFVGIPRHLLTY